MTIPRLVVGDLFSGIGGFSYAASWFGWRTAWFSEIDPFASQVLQARFPGVPNHGDITQIDFTTVEPIDILVGGFPCQDISNAGKRVGIEGHRSGLWKEYARAIRILRPRYVVVENVAAITRRGLDTVLGDLAEIGYDAEWDCFKASAIGAPHQRDRWWLLAYRPFQFAGDCGLCEDCGDPWCERHGDHYAECVCVGPDEELMGDSNGEQQLGLFGGICTQGSGTITSTGSSDPVDADSESDMADTIGSRLERHAGDEQDRPSGTQPDRSVGTGGVCHRADAAAWWLPQPAVGGAPDGISRHMVGPYAAWERGIPRVVPRPRQHKQELMALGNAIVPQCAAVLFERVCQHLTEAFPR